MTTPSHNPYQNNQPQQGGSVHHPEIAKDIKNAKNYGIGAIVLAALSLVIGILALPSLFLGIYGLKTSKKLAQAGVVQGNSKTLNTVAVVLGAVAVALWVLTLVLRAMLAS
ncbi:hypothetical protein ACN08Y_02530 [Rothia sp. P5764]|uniref:hypothetical protein n=1 Tax=unclassified Rothia (in: high G+C Gram-positive bacteria) TaxID=2689056 RepID=UPI003ABE677C